MGFNFGNFLHKATRQTSSFFHKVGDGLRQVPGFLQRASDVGHQIGGALSKGASIVSRIAGDPGVMLASSAFGPEMPLMLAGLSTGSRLVGKLGDTINKTSDVANVRSYRGNDVGVVTNILERSKKVKDSGRDFGNDVGKVTADGKRIVKFK
jgi:hypothetical protein